MGTAERPVQLENLDNRFNKSAKCPLSFFAPQSLAFTFRRTDIAMSRVLRLLSSSS